MPEKCHAERDEESNLDRGKGEERRSQPAETQPVSVISVWWDAH